MVQNNIQSIVPVDSCFINTFPQLFQKPKVAGQPYQCAKYAINLTKFDNYLVKLLLGNVLV